MAKAVKKSGTGPKAKTRKKKQQRSVPSGVVHVKATFNNTIITITDPSGNVIAWASAGTANFTGSRKSSAFAATVAAKEATKTAMGLGMREAEICLRGPGAGRESAVRGVQSAGVIVTAIRDKTPVAHNGCRPRKRRRA